jgi:hypothetical protein
MIKSRHKGKFCQTDKTEIATAKLIHKIRIKARLFLLTNHTQHDTGSPTSCNKRRKENKGYA